MMESSKFKILPPSLKINYDSSQVSSHVANGGIVGNKHLKKALSNYNVSSDVENSIIDDNATVIEVWLEHNQALFSNLKMTAIYICVDSECSRVSAVLNTNPFATATKWRKHIFVYVIVLEGMGRNTRLIKTHFMPIPTAASPNPANPNSPTSVSTSSTSSLASLSAGNSPTSSTVSLPPITAASMSPNGTFVMNVDVASSSSSSSSVGSPSSSTANISQSFSSASSFTSANLIANGNQPSQQQQQQPAFLSFINNVIHKVTPPTQLQTQIENIQYLLIQSIQRALNNFVNSIQRDRLYYNQVISYKKNEGMYLPTLFLSHAGLSSYLSPSNFSPPISSTPNTLPNNNNNNVSSTLSIPGSSTSSTVNNMSIYGSPLSTSPSSSVMFLPMSSSPSSQTLQISDPPSPPQDNQSASLTDDEDSLSSSPNSSEISIVVSNTNTITPNSSIPQSKFLSYNNVIYNIIPSHHYNNFAPKKTTPILSNNIVLGGSRQSKLPLVDDSNSSSGSAPPSSPYLSGSSGGLNVNATPSSSSSSLSPSLAPTSSTSSFVYTKPRGLKLSKEQGERPSLSTYETKDGFGCAATSSLYGWDFEKKERSGEPFADCFSLSTTPHPNLRATLAIADGSGLGPDPHRAATMAVLGANDYLDNIGSIEIATTNDLLTVIGNAIMEGHMRIIEDEHYQSKEVHIEPKGATTFCIGCLGQTKNILQNLSSSRDKKPSVLDPRAQQFSRPLPPPPPKSKYPSTTTTTDNNNINTSSDEVPKRKNSYSNNTDCSTTNCNQLESDEVEVSSSNVLDYEIDASDITINELPGKVETILAEIQSLEVTKQSKQSSDQPTTPRQEELQQKEVPKSPLPSPRVVENTDNQQSESFVDNNNSNEPCTEDNNNNTTIKKFKPQPPPRTYKSSMTISPSNTSISSISSSNSTAESISSASTSTPRLASTDGQWFFMIGSVGDCRAFRWSCTSKKVTEITNVKPSRNFNEAGGQLGWMWGGDEGQWPYNAMDYPADQRPELKDELIRAKNEKSRPNLKNLHFGLVLVNPGDRVFIASDGVTDNFLNMNPSINEDKVVTKEELEQNISNFIKSQPPEVISTCERLCQAMVIHCLEKTQNFRSIQEEMSRTLLKMKEIETSGEDLSTDQTYQLLKKGYSKLVNSIRHIKYGKPDHCSIVMYEVPYPN